MDNNPTPNHQKQCECKEPATCEIRGNECGKCHRCLLPLPPQEEKVSEEKLYYLRGGTPEGYEKLNTALKSVEPQIGGALRRLQVQDEARMEKGAKLFSRDFTETIEDLATEDSAAPENEHVNNMEGKGKDFTRSPENDSWEKIYRSWNIGHKHNENCEWQCELPGKIKALVDEAHARGKREERERARKLILQFDQEMTDQNVGDSYFEARNRLMALLEEARNHE